MKQVILRAEDVFTASQEFKSFADSMPQIVWLADQWGMTYYYNARWYEYMGTEEGHDKAPYFYSTVLHPDDRERALTLWQRCVRERIQFEIEYRFIDKERGGHRWFLARALPVSKNGRITWHGTYTDIHEQKSSEAQLSEGLHFRDEFLSVASHELKTPLTSLKLQLQFALRSLKAGKEFTKEERLNILEVCLRQSNRLSTLVEDLLDITRIQNGIFSFNFKETDVVGLVRSISEELSFHTDSAGTKVKLDVPDKLVANVDPQKLEQVLLNLFINSLKYAAGSEIRIALREEGDQVHLDFQDEGPGIAENKQAKIFERYERAVDFRHIAGLGLGLYIVKQIVDGHQGEITLESKPGSGTKFLIALPKNPVQK